MIVEKVKKFVVDDCNVLKFENFMVDCKFV